MAKLLCPSLFYTFVILITIAVLLVDCSNLKENNLIEGKKELIKEKETKLSTNAKVNNKEEIKELHKSTTKTSNQLKINASSISKLKNKENNSINNTKNTNLIQIKSKTQTQIELSLEKEKYEVEKANAFADFIF